MRQELLVGVDVGCRSHHVAIAEAGKIVSRFAITHDSHGFARFFAEIALRARQQKAMSVLVGMEGMNGYARPLDQLVQKRGYQLINVNNLKLARFKEIFAAPAKTDRIDADQIVSLMMMAPLMEQMKESLQSVPELSDAQMQLKRLCRRRRQLVQEKITVQNRMQADLQAVCPGFLDIVKQVDLLYVLRFLSFRSDLRQLARLKPQTIESIYGIGKATAKKLACWQESATFGMEIAWVGPMIVEDAKRILALKSKIAELELSMKKLIEQSELASLILSIPGFGLVCAAEIAGEIGAVSRFESEAGLALYLGMAPLDNSSGKYKGTKTARQVNKRAKAAMMTAIGIHRRIVPESKAHYNKKRAEGKTYNQALRSLGRHMVRVIWRMIQDNRVYQYKKDSQVV